MPTVSPPSSTACALFSPLVLCHCPTAQEDPALAHALAVNGLVRDTSPAASDSVNAVTGTTNAATGIAAAFARLLAPFESSPSAGQPLRRADSTLGQTYELQQAGFRVRFRGSVPVSQVDIANAQLLLRDMSVATTSSPTTSTLDDTPHFDAFTARALSAIGVGEHETFHHPVAMIYTVSSSPLSTTGSADPLALLQRLVDRSVVVPPEMERYMMGMGEILRFYVVVHDRLKSSGADGDAR